MKKALIGLAMLASTISLFGDAPSISPEKLMGMGFEDYEINGQVYPVMTLMYDTDGDGAEDAKFTYQFIPYDEARIATRLIEYAIDWSKNGMYEDGEKTRVEHDN